MKKVVRFTIIFWVTISHGQLMAQELPKILSDETVRNENYLPDFSYAGYRSGEDPLPDRLPDATIVYATKYGVTADDGTDDSKALLSAVKYAHGVEGPVIVELPAGRIILSEIIYIERSNFILRGTGSGEGGTIIYGPRSMKYFPDPPALSELREYLIELDKRQREPENNIDLPFSQYAWAGGMIWTRFPGVRTKAYLDKYDVAPVILAKPIAGERGGSVLRVHTAAKLRVGEVVQIEWYNRDGEKGSLLNAMYDGKEVKIGSHHWQYPNHSLVQQQVLIIGINGNEVTINDVLLHDLREEWQPLITEWQHLKEVGIEHLRFEFPMAPNIAHHIEEGYNALYLTRLFNGWVKDITIKNADSGILTEEVANVTISEVVTLGEKLAHYSVSMSGVHNVLVEQLTVSNPVRHPLSFNTFSTKSVYSECVVERDPILDQHSGANHQNLFDNITVLVSPQQDGTFPLFAGGGAGYWKPSHGAFTTFWNINVHFRDGLADPKPVLLNGMEDGPSARLIGIYGNKKVNIEYGPGPYVEWLNKMPRDIPSLYQYQLKKRLHNKNSPARQETK